MTTTRDGEDGVDGPGPASENAGGMRPSLLDSIEAALLEIINGLRTPLIADRGGAANAVHHAGGACSGVGATSALTLGSTLLGRGLDGGRKSGGGHPESRAEIGAHGSD